MAYIAMPDVEEAEGVLGEIFRKIGAARGGVADVHRVQGLNPRALVAHLELYKAIVFARSPLSRVMRERIAVVVSVANRCVYCAAHHGEALRRLGDSSEVIAALSVGRIPDEVSRAEGALLRWATRAAREPEECTEEDVAGLRRQGFEERAILDATLTVAYFSFVNRLVLMLGLAVEEGYSKTCGDGDGEMFLT